MRIKLLQRNTLVQTKRLEQFEADSAATELFVRIRAVVTLRVEYSRGIGQFSARTVVVAYNKVDTQRLSLGYSINRFNTTIEGNNQRKPVFSGPFNALPRNTIPFFIAVRYVIIDSRMIVFQEAIDQRHRRSSVYVVIAIDKN